MTNCTCN